MTQRHDILASWPDGREFHCFTWTRDPAAGIERAKREARDFGYPQLRDFRAEPASRSVKVLAS